MRRPVEQEIYIRLKRAYPNEYLDALLNEKKSTKPVVKHPGAKPEMTRSESILISRENSYEQIAKIYKDGVVVSLTIDYSPARESYTYKDESWDWNDEVGDEVYNSWLAVAPAREEEMRAFVVYRNVNFNNELDNWKRECDRHARSQQSNKEANERLIKNIEHNRAVIRNAIHKDLTKWRTVAKDLKEELKNES